MATVSKIYDAAYGSGTVTLSLNEGDLAIICVHWTWNTSVSYQYSSGTISVNSVDIGGYSQYIAENGDAKGDFMKIGIYRANATGNIGLSLSPIDTIAQERYIRLTVIKLTPDSLKKFDSGSYFVGVAYRGRDSAVGSKSLSVANNLAGDIFVGLSTSINSNGTLHQAWTSPAVEQVDLYVNDYTEVTVATQISENANDEFLYYQDAGLYNGGVAIAVRESFKGGLVIIWES